MSISFNQEEILRDIIDLHLKGEPIQCDPMYSTGGFYRSGIISQPMYFSDINPQLKHVVKLSADDLGFPDNFLKSIILDPPFLVKNYKARETGKMLKRFGYFSNPQEMFFFFDRILKEAYRVLKPQGVLIFKIQDVLNGRKQFFSHCEVYNYAIERGFYPIDLFILMTKNRMTPPNKKNVDHARKHHSYFWVFKKVRAGVVDHYKNLLP